ncbi:hypothetical protein GJ629_03910 [Halapricum sp. CBA1109]|uniref:hypothetical protein n=1 Tax=Halapricum sp. CBA1109 TaxID=2668068 RepID=UPI0012FC1B28|nr:hypothetical protein [Halapricum sp. CBA1109]MUV89151.1 hypothetical protein [Halapricum sp. CBA1109]
MADDDGDGFRATCPRCDAEITGEETACPECDLTFLDEDDGLSDEAVQAMLDDVDVDDLDSPAPGRIGAPATVRLFVGLAITAPLAPLVVFVALAVVPLPTWAAVALGTAAWTLPGYLLARPLVPTQIVANGLLLVGVVLSTTPLTVTAGRALVGTDASDVGALGANVADAGPLFLTFGLVVLVVGAVVRRHALSTRARWERDAAEGPRE